MFMCFVFIFKNSHFRPIKHKMIGSYGREEKCLLRGTDLVFKQSSLRLVFNWLNHIG
jgi:hypothetical protein